VEHLADGIAYCQIFDAMFPNKNVPLHKLDFNAKRKDEFIKNVVLLKDIARRFADKDIDVERLSSVCWCTY
jgi:hypothetical protein